MPQANRGYWETKLDRNVKRDARNRRKLRRLGWRVLTVWECQTGAPRLKQRIAKFLGSPDERAGVATNGGVR